MCRRVCSCDVMCLVMWGGGGHGCSLATSCFLTVATRCYLSHCDRTDLLTSICGSTGVIAVKHISHKWYFSESGESAPANLGFNHLILAQKLSKHFSLTYLVAV